MKNGKNELAMSIAKLVSSFISMLIDDLIAGGDFGDKKVKDIAGWRDWERIKAKASTGKVAASIRKYFRK